MCKTKYLSCAIAVLMSVAFLGLFSASAQSSTIIPDPNGDGKISIADVILVTRYLNGQIATSPQTDNYDINQNGVISTFDVKLLSLYLSHEWEGDN